MEEAKKAKRESKLSELKGIHSIESAGVASKSVPPSDTWFSLPRELEAVQNLHSI